VIDLYLRENHYKMFSAPETAFLPLHELKDWEMDDTGIRQKLGFPFRIIYCGLEIEGREVAAWNQPLFAAEGEATFGLIACRNEGRIEILVQMKPEIGCFDAIELGPTVQEEAGTRESRDATAEFFFRHIEHRKPLIDVILSEEGGRFYHEQNRNVVVFADKKDVPIDETRYVWASIGTLNALTQINNCLNIQLRNLLMLFAMYCEGETK